MTELRLRPRTVSELVDAAFALYRQNSTQYILVSALANVPLLIVQLIVQPTNPATLLAAGATVLLVLSLASIVTFSFMGAAVVRLGSDAYLGREPDLANTLREVIARVPALIIANILLALLLFIGFVLLFVGAIYVAARYFAASVVIVLEGKGPVDAFGRAAAVSRDRRWHVFKTMLLVFLIYFILSIGVSAVATLTGSYVIQLVASTLFTIVAYPVIALTQMVLYYDCRIRNEGFDLEQMAATLDAGSAATIAAQ